MVPSLLGTPRATSGTGDASIQQHKAVLVLLLSTTCLFWVVPWDAHGHSSLCPTDASKQVGAGGLGLAPALHSLPAGLFLTQPVQLVHVVVSGERNLGNVVIWRRTCPLRGNGTSLGESRGTGTGLGESQGTGTVQPGVVAGARCEAG